MTFVSVKEETPQQPYSLMHTHNVSLSLPRSSQT